ncbi:MAG: NAD(P)H-quinone oxidoreductase subunit L [Synechococcaceae cyanobacterium]|nr:NAD(P)H-quinone oxidoreductase subunit L [Synechococcaceae cyanobacterium]
MLPGFLSAPCGAPLAPLPAGPFAALPAGLGSLGDRLSGIPTETLLVLAAYASLGGLYLVVVPLALLAWMTKRWTAMGKIERTVVYGLVFLFFPGLILFAPFLNLRMAGQGPDAA